jgi:hypothetical protein
MTDPRPGRSGINPKLRPHPPTRSFPAIEQVTWGLPDGLLELERRLLATLKVQKNLLTLHEGLLNLLDEGISRYILAAPHGGAVRKPLTTSVWFLIAWHWISISDAEPDTSTQVCTTRSGTSPSHPVGLPPTVMNRA